MNVNETALSAHIDNMVEVGIEQERARWVAAVEEVRKWMSENRMPDWEEGAHEALDKLLTRMEASND